MAESGCLKNQFLVATPCLDAGIFKSSVTYICEHSEEGAMGVIINRPSTLLIQDILKDLADSDLPEREAMQEVTGPVMVGGPVGLERGFVLHQTVESENHWDSSLQVSSDIVLTGSKDILIALREGRGPEHYLVALGYAGWSAGQLEQELADNAWLTVPAQQDILFSTPYHLRAEQAIKALGIDLAALSTTAGNA